MNFAVDILQCTVKELALPTTASCLLFHYFLWFCWKWQAIATLIFFYCSIRRQSKALLNGSSLEFLCYCVENLFSLKPTALYSASPPAYKHCGTLHCGSSLPINLYLSASVELRAFLRCYSSGSISKARPSPLHLILSMARFFFIHSSAASLSAFIFIACIYA